LYTDSEEDGDYDYYYAPPSSAVDDEIYDTLIDRSRPVLVAAQVCVSTDILLHNGFCYKQYN